MLRHFGTQRLKDEINEISTAWKYIFYPSGVTTTANADERDATKARAREGQACSRPDIMDIFMAVSYILVPPNDLQSIVREAKEEAQEAERRRVQEKVEAWMKQINSV